LVYHLGGLGKAVLASPILLLIIITTLSGYLVIAELATTGVMLVEEKPIKSYSIESNFIAALRGSFFV
jgi:hypothetical protein